MLKFRLNRDTGPLLVFGLSADDIKKLQGEEGMKINLEVLGLPGDVYIFAGDTDETLLKEFEALGLCLPSKASTKTAN